MKPHDRYRELVDAAEKLEERLPRAEASRLPFIRLRLDGLHRQIEVAREQMKASDNLDGLRIQVHEDPSRLLELLDMLEKAGFDDELVEKAYTAIETIQALPRAQRRAFQKDLDDLVERHNRAQQRVNARGG